MEQQAQDTMPRMMPVEQMDNLVKCGLYILDETGLSTPNRRYCQDDVPSYIWTMGEVAEDEWYWRIDS